MVEAIPESSNSDFVFLKSDTLFTKPAKERLTKKREQMFAKIRGRRPPIGEEEGSKVSKITGDKAQIVDTVRKLAFKGHLEVQDALLDTRDLRQLDKESGSEQSKSLNESEGSLEINKTTEAKIKSNETESANAAASKISEDDMKKKLLEAAAAASQPVAASEENTEDLEDMLDDLI